MKSFDEILADRIGFGATVGIAGGAFGGSLIGASITGAGHFTPESPILVGVLGVFGIAGATALCGWYLPPKDEIEPEDYLSASEE